MHVSPENTKVFHAEDHSMVRRTVSIVAERLGGHSVVATATSYEEALEMIDQLDELDVNVAIIDGNLTKGKNTGEEGAAIAHLIKEKHPHITTIGLSLNPVEGVDIMIEKGSDDVARLGEIIRDLP